MLERALNYAHTGSARVLTRSLMDRAWLSLSVVSDGLPCISNSFIQAGSLSSGLVTIRREKWPVHPVTRIPLTASQRSQEMTYGKPHYSVSVIIVVVILLHALCSEMSLSRVHACMFGLVSNACMAVVATVVPFGAFQDIAEMREIRLSDCRWHRAHDRRVFDGAEKTRT